MTKMFITPAEGAELKQLYIKFRACTRHAMAVLAARGMESLEFQDADRASGRAWERIREIRGETGQHWMHS